MFWLFFWVIIQCKVGFLLLQTTFFLTKTKLMSRQVLKLKLSIIKHMLYCILSQNLHKSNAEILLLENACRFRKTTKM